MPQWYSKESADKLEAQRNRRTATKTGGASARKAIFSRTPPAPPWGTEGNESYEIKGMPSHCVYMNFPLPITQFFNHDAFGKDSRRNKDFIPDLLSTLSAAWKYR
jgi:hypothetical protein